MSGKQGYYVQFKDDDGNMRTEYIMARNCSQAVESAKAKYNAKSIIKSGRESVYRRNILKWWW